jgi:hypothetical protein
MHARARLGAAGHGAPAAVRAGLAFLRSWQSSTALAGTPWLAGALRNSAGARRALERRLRILGTPRSLWRDAASRPAGAPARIAGVALAAAAARPAPSSHIWHNSEETAGGVRVLIEEGHDFFLRDEAGQIARVVAAGGTLLGGAGLDHGDPVEVLGFLDWIMDPGAPAASRSPRGEPLAPALGSTGELSLIVIVAGNG